jgi:hypothetical protein
MSDISAVSLGTLSSSAAGTSQYPENTNSKFQRGSSCLAVIQPTNGAFVGTCKIQGTNDLDSVADGSASWTDLLTFVAPSANSGSKMAVVTCMRRMRVNTTGTFTSGSVDGLLLSS